MRERLIHKAETRDDTPLGVFSESLDETPSILVLFYQSDGFTNSNGELIVHTRSEKVRNRHFFARNLIRLVHL